MLEGDYKEIIEYKLEKFRKNFSKIERSYQGDVDYEDLLDDTVQDLMKLFLRALSEGIE